MPVPSSARSPKPRAAPRRRALALVASAAMLAAAGRAEGKVFLGQDQALELAFGKGARVEKRTAFLTEAQIARARELAGPGVAVDSALVTRYAGSRDGTPLGHAYFDTHVVRTLPETLMVVVDASGTVAKIEVVVFAEPEDYLPRRTWLDRILGRRLDRELALRRGVDAITGATISSQAATDAVRRVLAIDAVLEGRGEPSR